ncbi:DUF805 domain-containing protein [Shewanella sp. DAU334]|uniref:DUF805 domain-containing protein n=1 Tax=Shewanella youngdeokensis TaxID=2999068 RepID=A0ABZ0JXB3_9GAMM|nr:DUF805 domain-containing protein [Shewanella sp. DAU334]
MQFTALFCLNGRDNGQRFAIISGLTYLILLLAGLVLGATSFLYIVGLLLSPVVGFSCLRRLRDAEKSVRLSALVLVPLLLVTLTLVHISSSMLLVTSLLLAAICTAYVAILPAAAVTQYQQGYSGPIKIPARSTRNTRARVEPTLDLNKPAEDAQHHDGASTAPQANTTSPRQQQGHGTLLALQRWVINNPKNTFGVSGALILVMLVLSVYSLAPDQTYVAEQEQADIEHPAPAVVPRKITTLPDGFSLALEDDVLIVRWLGERGAPANLWSLATAKGDKSCSTLAFNNGTQYRPVVVDLLADTGTEARFSPLDTKAIIVDMARRGSVSLCGYKFSLKGSQAALAKVGEFSAYL